MKERGIQVVKEIAVAATVGESGNARLGVDDVVVVVSGSGRTASALAIAAQARAASIGRLCAITAADESPLNELADLVVRLHGRAKGGAAAGVAPFTAQFDAGVLCLSEVVARLVMDSRGVEDADIENWRPNVE
jgi:D-arabinose 5-phosphate isomerase GutQ